MRLLVITQKVDADDAVMGFFHGWLKLLSPLVSRLDVIGNSAGRYALPSHVRVYSLGKDRGYPRPIRYVLFLLYVMRTLPFADGVFVHMCPEYVRGIHWLNFFFRKPVIMWYAHIRVSPTARWAIKHVDAILSPSGESFCAEAEGKLIATGHGIDTERFHPPETPHPRGATLEVISVGRVTPVKNIEALIEALNLLVNERGRRDIRVSFIGAPAVPSDKGHYETLKEKLARYKLEPYFTWAGAVANRDLTPRYQNADLYVRMQEGGGFGKVELEAMACGVPVVLNTPVYKPLLGEFAEETYWRDGEIEMLADKIETVLSWDASRRERYGVLARSVVVSHHNLANLVRKIVGEFASLSHGSQASKY